MIWSKRTWGLCKSFIVTLGVLENLWRTPFFWLWIDQSTINYWICQRDKHQVRSRLDASSTAQRCASIKNEEAYTQHCSACLTLWYHLRDDMHHYGRRPRPGNNQNRTRQAPSFTDSRWFRTILPRGCWNDKKAEGKVDWRVEKQSLVPEASSIFPGIYHPDFASFCQASLDRGGIDNAGICGNSHTVKVVPNNNRRGSCGSHGMYT